MKTTTTLCNAICLLVLSCALSAEERIFISSADGKTKKEVYVFLEETIDGKTKHTTINEGETIESFIDSRGEFISQTIRGPKRDIRIGKAGSNIVVSGIINQKKVETSYDLGDKKYFGDGFSLAFRYLMSNKLKELPFIIADFRTDQVTFNEMIIYREADLRYKNKPASHCVIRMTGILSLFWAGDFIISSDGKTIYKFEGNQGPGTPHEVIELESVH